MSGAKKYSPNFFLSEMQCPCCETVKIHPGFIVLLEDLREEYNSPMAVTSGYRCEDHDRELKKGREGPYKRSVHCDGHAVDVRMVNAVQRYKLIKLAMKRNMRIGVYPSHVHLDNSGITPPVLWHGVY